MSTAARAALAGLALAFAALLGGEAGAQQAFRPEIDPGQVQKRIPEPRELPAPPPELHVPSAKPVTPGAPLRFVLTGVVIEGATVFDAAALAPLYEPHLAQEVDLGDIERIVRAITAKYRAAGYFLSRAVARPQPLEQGILRITVIEGYVRQVVFRDATAAEEAALRGYFAGLADRRPLPLEPLERALLLADDVAGLHLDSSLQPVDEESGAYDLVLRVRHQRFTGLASLDNRGTQSLGPWQAQLTGGVNSVVSPLDHLQLSVFDTINRPSELVSPELFYDLSVDSSGTRLGLSVMHTVLRPRGIFTSQDLDASATRYTAKATHPLLRSRERSLWLGLDFDLLDSSERSAGVPLFDDHVRALRGTANYADKDAAGNADLAALELSRGLGFLGASHPGGGLSRDNGRADFTKLAGSLTRQQVFGEHWGVQLALAGQKSADPLLLAEQFALGGVAFGRAYDPDEIAGDDALAGSLELRYGRFVESPVLRSYQLYGFYDLGTVWNIAATGATPARQSLASLGGGIRLALQHDLSASFEIAKPLTRRVAEEGGKPVRVFVSISAPF